MFGFKKISAKLDDVLSKISLCRIEIEAVSSKLKELEPIINQTATTSNSSLSVCTKLSEERQKVFFEKRNIIKFGEKLKCSQNIIIPDNGNAFNVTGPGVIKTITANGSETGECIVLFFDSKGSVNHNALGNGHRIILSKGSVFEFEPGNTLTLIFDGDKWIEVSRS